MIHKIFISYFLVMISFVFATNVVLADCSCVCMNAYGSSAARNFSDQATCQSKCLETNPTGDFTAVCTSASAVSSKSSSLLPAPLDGKQVKPDADKGCPPGLSGSNCGNYQINDLLVLGKNVTNWILGMVGSAALLMFIWGGLQWLTSQGEAAKITEGKKIITTAVIGMIIVFTSYLIVKFVVVDMLGMTWEGGYINSGTVKKP